MAELRCDVCGGTIQMQAGGYRGVCLNCRVVYSLPRLRELWAELQKPEDLRRRISPDPDCLPEALPQKVAETAGNGEFEIKKDGTLVHYRGVGPHVVIPNGVTRIGAWSFAGNACITSLVIPEGVKVISKGAFSGLTSLQELKLPEGLETIETWAFSSCENLTSVTMPQSVVEVADRAFENCVRLTGLTTGEGIVVEDTAFEPVQAAPIVLDAGFLSSEFFDIQDGILVKYLGKTPWVEIPRGVHRIGMAAFKDHTALKSVTIPEGVTEIGPEAFSGCIALKKMELPKALRSIGPRAFVYCGALERIILPDGVETGEGAFEGTLYAALVS